MKKLLCLIALVAVVLSSAPALSQGVSIQVCTNEDTDQKAGTCYRLRWLSSLAAGMGGAAGLKMLPVGALLYAHGAAGTPLVLNIGAGTADGALRVVEASDSPGAASLAKNPWAKADDDETNVCTALDTSSQQYTIPQVGDWYIIKVVGNTAYILGGANPTATTAANGHVYPISSGEKLIIRVTSAKVAHIAGTAVGEICFLRLNGSL